jgi:STAS domain
LAAASTGHQGQVPEVIRSALCGGTALLLPGTHCRSVYVDLAGITFAGTSLVNFLITVSARLPVGVSMSLCGPTPIVRRIIELTSLDQIAAVQDGLPANWAAPPRPSTDTPPADRDGAMKAPHAPAAGLCLDDRYRLIKQIGSGGMSVAFAAHDEILQRQVAVKTLAPSLTADPALARRLLLEARAVATLCHPHIAPVFDFGVHRADDGTVTPYLVMRKSVGRIRRLGPPVAISAATAFYRLIRRFFTRRRPFVA